MSELCSALGKWLVPAPPARGAAVPFTRAQGKAIAEARSLIEAKRFLEAIVGLVAL
jgi:hypothetical protein